MSLVRPAAKATTPTHKHHPKKRISEPYWLKFLVFGSFIRPLRAEFANAPEFLAPTSKLPDFPTRTIRTLTLH
ncbi:MAG: hypothetical protein RLZZ436_2313 [Planctomycetota bacterium]|jgi:hypothetical protein